MVTAYSACHAGRDTYDAYGVSDGEYLQCYGDKYAEGTPAGTRSEAEEAADKEYYGRQEGLEALGRTLYGRSYVCASPEGIGHCLEGPGAGQYQYCWDHGLEAFGQHAHHFGEAHKLAELIKNDGYDESEGGAQHKAYGSVGA